MEKENNILITKQQHFQFCDRLFKFHYIGVFQDKTAETSLKHSSRSNVVIGVRIEGQKTLIVQSESTDVSPKLPLLKGGANMKAQNQVYRCYKKKIFLINLALI